MSATGASDSVASALFTGVSMVSATGSSGNASGAASSSSGAAPSPPASVVWVQVGVRERGLVLWVSLFAIGCDPRVHVEQCLSHTHAHIL